MPSFAERGSAFLRLLTHRPADIVASGGGRRTAARGGFSVDDELFFEARTPHGHAEAEATPDDLEWLTEQGIRFRGSASFYIPGDEDDDPETGFVDISNE